MKNILRKENTDLWRYGTCVTLVAFVITIVVVTSQTDNPLWREVLIGCGVFFVASGSAAVAISGRRISTTLPFRDEDVTPQHRPHIYYGMLLGMTVMAMGGLGHAILSWVRYT